MTGVAGIAGSSGETGVTGADGASVADHDLLSNRGLANAHTQYVNVDGTTDITGNQTLKNSTDTTLSLLIDSGASAGQFAQIIFQDSQTGSPLTKWTVRKTNSNIFEVVEGVGNSSVIVIEEGIRADDQLHLDGSGDVGVGTSVPSVKLDVDGDILARGEIVADNNADTSNAVIVDSGSGSAQESTLELSDRGTAKWVWAKTASNNLLLRDTATATEPISVDAGAGTNTLKITAAGWVGIGKVPTTKLDVNGVITGTGLNILGAGSFSTNLTVSGLITAPFVTITDTLFLNGANVVLGNTNKLIGEDTGAVQRDLAYVDVSNITNFGDQTLETCIHVATNSGLEVKVGASARTQIWHEGNMGPGSGLDSDTVDGVHGTDLLNWGATDFIEHNFGVKEGGNEDLKIAHGFGTTPRLCLMFLLNIETDHDWDPGDVVAYQATVTDSGCTVYANDTFVGMVINNTPNILRKISGFSTQSIDWTDWEFIIRAWK
jgi:hypothetical protein